MKQLKFFTFLLSFILGSILSVAQFTLGEATLTYVKAKSLRQSQTIATAVRSIEYLSRVGGVAFDQTASPEPALTVSELKLQYSSAQADGSRFSVVINGNTAAVKLYDWELVPIAKYANSNDNACFTLFGDLDDKARAEKIVASGGRVLNYHPQFVNTLMGLRLFQLDILILTPELSTDLPKEKGVYKLGKGESAPGILLNKAGFTRFETRFGDNLDDTFSSYLICDRTRNIVFGIRNNSLAISGTPFYHFWKYNILTDQPDYVSTLSNDISAQPSMLRAINPAVWDAGVKTMRYAAFFRFCKANFPEQWDVFLGQLNRVIVTPAIETPTVLKF